MENIIHPEIDIKNLEVTSNTEKRQSKGKGSQYVVTLRDKLFLNHVQGTRNGFFFMDWDGEYEGPSFSQKWADTQYWEPKPVVKKLPEHLIESANKILDFIWDCKKDKVSPTKELWLARTDEIASTLIIRNQNQSKLENISIKTKIA